MEKLQVSVVMPAYNCAKTIAQAIDSVLIQEVPLELIVVNDCSPEDLDGVMAQYKDDSRVVCVEAQKIYSDVPRLEIRMRGSE